MIGVYTYHIRCLIGLSIVPAAILLLDTTQPP